MPEKPFFDWETNSDRVDKLALQSRKDTKVLEKLLLSGRMQQKFVDHAYSMSQNLRLLSFDDMLSFLMLTIWQAACSEGSLRWDEREGVPFASWVLRLWNHRMLIELQAEKAQKRLPVGGLISLEHLMEKAEIYELSSMRFSSPASTVDYYPSLTQYDSDLVDEVSVEIFLSEVGDQRGEDAQKMCELILEGFTRADIAKAFYPDVWYQARWQRINLFFQSLVPIAEEVGFVLE